MMSLLHRFAALALILSALHALLPEGSLRRTAMMCAGLIVALCYLQGLQGALELPVFSESAAVLTDSGVSAGDLSAAEEVYARQAERAQDAR